ncbi:MAG: hypothetical protein WBC09_01935, partial [Thermoanaerobaculia bacterium]
MFALIRGGRVQWVVLSLILAGLFMLPISARAQICGSEDTSLEDLPADLPICSSSGPAVCRCPSLNDLTFCAEPTLVSASAGVTSQGCDPKTTPCDLTVTVVFDHPGNTQTVIAWDPDPAPTPYVFWYLASDPPDCDPSLPPFFGGCDPVSGCGIPGIFILEQDRSTSSLILDSIDCSNHSGVQLSVTAFACPVTANGSACRRKTNVSNLGGEWLGAQIGCLEPPSPEPPKTEGGQCSATPAGGAEVFGSGLTTTPANGSPANNPALTYRAGGAGHPGLPGSDDWTETLGLYWSHEAAQRIIPDPDESHVWLITEFGSFREFSALVAGVYETNSPSDEFRELRWTGADWELHDLDGTVVYFDGDGFWRETADRNGNTTTATYTDGRLTKIAFPDKRTELFTYYEEPDAGKLESITEVGIDDTTERSWTYTWAGDLLTRIERPDDTFWEFFYNDPDLEGYMTRMDLVGTGGVSRVERGWEFDGSGNVIRTWKG